jgi:hypothetical protein
MDKEERAFFARMSKALEEMSKALERMSSEQKRVADVMERQQPSKAAQIFATAGAIGAAIGGFSAVDLVIKWITGGCYADAIDYENHFIRDFGNALDYGCADEKR